MITVRRDRVIGWLKSGDCPDGNRFLANVQVQEPADFPLRVSPRSFFFESPDLEHLPVKREVEIVGMIARRGHVWPF
jgi:hypothetical protein